MMPTHRYMVNGKRVPSVTTIIGRFKDAGPLIYWAWDLGIQGIDYRDESQKAMSIGTVAHRLVDMHIHDPNMALPNASTIASNFNISVDMAATARESFKAYLEWAAQVKLRIAATEKPLTSKRHKFGGCLDAMLWIGGKRSVGDWKTSKGVYIDYLLQLAAYGLLWKENFPNQPITGGYYLIRFDKEHGDFAHHHYRDLPEAEQQFLLFREAYENDKILKRRI